MSRDSKINRHTGMIKTSNINNGQLIMTLIIVYLLIAGIIQTIVWIGGLF